MRKYGGKSQIGVIAIFSATAFAIVGLHRASGRAYSAAPVPTLFVTDNSTDAVTAYSAASNGDVPPLALAPTGLSAPQSVTVDASGKIYVTSRHRITIFAKGSKGDAAPIATIAGSNTGLNQPVGIALDASGRIYVADEVADSVFVYPPLGSSTGALNEAPAATISGGNTGLSLPVGIAVDSDRRIYVADQGDGSCDTTASVFVYSAGSNGDAAPLATIYGYDQDGNPTLCWPWGIAVDSSRNIYVADAGASSVYVYPTGSNGYVAPSGGISGRSTGLISPTGIRLDSSGNIYVADCADCYGSSGTDKVSVYLAGTNGSVAPIATISGGSTGLSSPTGIALDSSANIYVADQASNSATIYPPLGSSTGLLNEAPTATISTTIATGLSFPEGVALDSSGKIYVADDGPSGAGPAGVFVYPAGSNGNAAPAATITGASTGLSLPEGIALDSSGNIYLADDGDGNCDSTPALYAYSAASNGDVAPSATITGNNTGLCLPSGIALDSSRNIYVADGASSVYVYPAGSNGNVAPSATITGATTGLISPTGIALDSSANIYVADQGDGGCDTTASVYVYPAGSNGDAAPSSTIAGAGTGLCLPVGIALDSSGNIYVADESVGVLVYSAESNGNVAPVRTISGPLTELGSPQFIAIQPPAATPTATATPIPAKLTISPHSLPFGNKVTAGTTSKSKTVTIKNAGSKKTGLAVSIESESASSPAFTVASACAETLDPGKSCKVSVTFTPPDTTLQTGTLMIYDNVIGEPQSVPMSGTGKAAK